MRTAKTVGGSTKYFVYNGMQIVFEYEDSVSDGTTYYYGLNRTHSSDGDMFVYNAHGDTVQLVNNNAVVVSYTYDAFGNLTNTIGESDNAFLYCSEYFDAETQTYYLRARYYNPANGRFTQQDAWEYIDTADPLSLNLYTYCVNNPVAYVDPSGRFGVLGFLAVAAGLVFTLSGCSSVDQAKKPTVTTNNDQYGGYDPEFFTPGTHLYDKGFWTYEEALASGITKIYDYSFGKNGNSVYENGVFIYYEDLPIDGGDYLRRYFAGRVYNAPTYETDNDASIYVKENVPDGATAITFIHTHNKHKESGEPIFRTDETVNVGSYYNMCVVDIEGYVYYINQSTVLAHGKYAYDMYTETRVSDYRQK